MHNIIVRYYKNNQVSVHNRKDTGDCKIAVHEQWANDRPEINSTVYKNIRAGLLQRIDLLIPEITEREGKAFKPAMERMLSHQGYNVIPSGQ